MRGLTIGEGLPKICVSLLGKTLEELDEEAQTVSQLPCQMVEWRADFFLKALQDTGIQDIKDIGEALVRTLDFLRKQIAVPLIFTIRTVAEGGQVQLEKDHYYYLNVATAATGFADFIDIEVFDGPENIDEQTVLKFIEYAHQKDTRVLLSSHNFHRTPEKEELLASLIAMQDLGADMAKLAVMPDTQVDVFRLMEVAAFMRDHLAEIPFIVISMGAMGAGSRICAGQYGSAVTFASGKGLAAPGQIPADELEKLMADYYQ